MSDENEFSSIEPKVSAGLTQDKNLVAEYAKFSGEPIPEEETSYIHRFSLCGRVPMPCMNQPTPLGVEMVLTFSGETLEDETK